MMKVILSYFPLSLGLVSRNSGVSTEFFCLRNPVVRSSVSEPVLKPSGLGVSWRSLKNENQSPSLKVSNSVSGVSPRSLHYNRHPK